MWTASQRLQRRQIADEQGRLAEFVKGLLSNSQSPSRTEQDVPNRDSPDPFKNIPDFDADQNAESNNPVESLLDGIPE